MLLQKGNVQRVVESKERIDQMLNDGWKEVVKAQPLDATQKDESLSYEKLKKDELIALLQEKGISFDEKAKKEELVQLLEGE